MRSWFQSLGHPGRTVMLAGAGALAATAVLAGGGCSAAGPSDDSLAAADVPAATPGNALRPQVANPPPPPLHIPPPGCASPQPITDYGYPGFQVYTDVNGDHYNDYCRFVGDAPGIFLSCQLSCGLSGNGYGVTTGYNSIPGIDQGYSGTATLFDIDSNGYEDFCRLVGNPGSTYYACDQGSPTGFSANQFSTVLPPNTPMIAVALAPVPASGPQGRGVSFNITVTNNLPFTQSGNALAEFVSTANPANTYTALTALQVQANSSATATVTLPAPAQGTYQAIGAFQQPTFSNPTLLTGQSAPQSFTATQPAVPPTITLIPIGDTSAPSSMTVTSGDTTFFNYTVDPGPYCGSSRWQIQYQRTGDPNGGTDFGPGGLTSSSISGQDAFNENVTGVEMMSATCENDTSLGARVYINVTVKAGSPPPPTTHEGLFTTVLQRGAPANGGNVYYGGYLPSQAIFGTANWVQNPASNGVTVSLVERGYDSSHCFDPNYSVTVPPGTTLASSDMIKLFGSANPATPLPIVACVESGGTPPQTIGMTIDYMYTQ